MPTGPTSSVLQSATSSSATPSSTRQSVARKSLVLGLRHFTRAELEGVRAAGEMLEIRVLGLASIAEDVSPELARATISSIEVLGALHASAAVKAAVADRSG